MNFKEIRANLSDSTGNVDHCNRVLDYVESFGETVKKAKQPGFTTDDWNSFASVIDVKNFERIGHHCEVMHWEEYIGFVTQFASELEWEGTFRRIQERGNVVYLQLTEYITVGEQTQVANTLTVYTFNETGKIAHLAVYIQQAPEQGK